MTIIPAIQWIQTYSNSNYNIQTRVDGQKSKKSTRTEERTKLTRPHNQNSKKLKTNS